MKARRALARAPLVLVYAALLTALAWHSSLRSLLPLDAEAVFPLTLYVFLALTLVLVPALLTNRSPLPAMLIVFVPVAALAAYEQSHLDWLRTLRQFDVTAPGAPSWPRLAIAAATVGVAWATHALDTSRRLHARLVDRGVAPEEATIVVRATGARTLLAAIVALGGFVVLALIGTIAYAFQVALGRVTFLMPIAAAVLVAVAAVLLSTRARGEQGDDDAAEA